jgi:UDP-GlcNAc:undecaprenyl-phosphate/decaprenyl-phosphate GlcNAc-1-phosphate transferase
VQLFLAFIVALSVTAALIPILARWAPAIGLTDAPGPRKVHSVPVPRVGGLAMAAGVLIPTVASVSLVPEIRGLLLGLLVLLLFGVWDDRVTLGYRTKLAGQIIAVGICMAVGGLHVGALTFNGFILPPVAGTMITFVFLVGITNAVNLADGLDGLAGGMVLLCLTAIALFATMSGNGPVTAVALIEAGAVLGFLRFNTHPARIFMGDSGSQVLGLSVGALGLMATQGDTCVLSAALPLLLLGLPIMDTLSVMWTRIRAGRSPFAADRNHLHHRLLALGFAHRDAVLIIYVMQAGLVLLAYFLRFESDAAVIVSYFGFAFAVLALLRVALREGWRAGRVIPQSLIRPVAPEGQELAAAQPSASGTRAPMLAVAVMTGCLLAYAISVIALTRTVRLDLGLTSAGLLVVLIALMSYGKERSVLWFERAAAYVSVVLLVYLDETMAQRPPLLSTLSWLCIGITGAAALIRFWVSPARRFEVTTLDLIVIFIALVMPNLPGNVELPPDLPAGLAKAIILLYVVEMLLTTNFQRFMPRTFLAVTLAFIACRALAGLAV